MGKGQKFPSLKADALLAILMRAPLAYRPKEEKGAGGSHRQLVSEEYPPITFSFHKGVTVGPHRVKKILTEQVGLSEDEAFKAVKGKL
jgi:predicted RNA binding protein YcfA (HicA-like mRNA interferase family)